MRNGLPFSKPKVRLFGDIGEAQAHLGEAYNLLFRVRQFCEASGVPVFSMQRSLPDGALVTAAVVGTEEIVAVTAGATASHQRKKPVRKLLPELVGRFFATPCSADHPSGYTPPREGTPYPGPSSVWEAFPQYDIPPDAAPKDITSDNAELTPVQTKDLEPGNVTWWSEAIKVKGEVLVLSWDGTQGRYAGATSAVVPTYYVNPTPNALGNSVLQGDGHDSSSIYSGARSSNVHINGVPMIGSVYGAWALRRTEETALEILAVSVGPSNLSLWAGPLPEAVLDALKEKDFSGEPSNVFSTMQLVQTSPNITISGIIHDPFINASATKCLLLARVRINTLPSDEGFFYYDGGSTNRPAEDLTSSVQSTYTVALLEWDFQENKLRTVDVSFFEGQTGGYEFSAESERIVGPPPTEGGLGNTTSQRLTGRKTYQTRRTKEHELLCADYKGDELVYLYADTTYTWPGYTLAEESFSSDIGTYVYSDGVYNWREEKFDKIQSSSITFDGDLSAATTLVHSKHGVVDALQIEQHNENFSYGGARGYHFQWRHTLTGSLDTSELIFSSAYGGAYVDSYVTLYGYLGWTGSFGSTDLLQPSFTSIDATLAVSVLGGDLRADSFLYEFVTRDASKTYVFDYEAYNPYGNRVTAAGGPVVTESSANEAVLKLYKRGSITEVARTTPPSRQVAVVQSMQYRLDDTLVGRTVNDPPYFYATYLNQFKQHLPIRKPGWNYQPPLEPTHPDYSASARERNDYVSFAADTTGDYIYYGVCQPESWDGRVEKNAFIIHGIEHVIEDQKYAPGMKSTLSKPVFFGKAVDKVLELDLGEEVESEN